MTIPENRYCHAIKLGRRESQPPSVPAPNATVPRMTKFESFVTAPENKKLHRHRP